MTKDPHRAAGWARQRYKVADHLELVADVGGDPKASAVILLHGGGQTRHSWGGAMRALIAQGYYVINLDTRGHGDSNWAPDGDYSLEVLAADLAKVIGTMPSPPALVGASMGGATALLVAGLRLAPAATLVLVDVVPNINPSGASKIIAFMKAHANGFAVLQEAVDAVADYNPHRPRPSNNDGLLKNLRQRANGRLYWHWDPRLLETSQGSEPPVFADKLNHAAAGVAIPTLLVRGLRSDIVTAEGIGDLKQRIPHLEVFDVAEAGHMVAGDDNDAFNRGVFGFLRKYMY